MNYGNLMAEVAALQHARGYGILEAVQFIMVYEEEYASEVRRELKDFKRECSRMFAPVEETV
jgi:hypothetical protein